ncbi:R3H and coiled-coil domain-containing protein 1 [Galendromus occidentalis]|uniref:R3H and coiled-coil domain-containing protein 1 n=1 Tax=Galendromus occidentalis TaxID=34638 RepID=A0AAJ6QXH5_9ACAR|nr:R3H and coiled-coil domain-containing protein 1 [Galendromus occidentalis]
MNLELGVRLLVMSEGILGMLQLRLLGGCKSVKVATIQGRYLTLEEQAFINVIEDDIENFLKSPSHDKSVLVLPDLPAFRRFIVHKIVEEKFWRLTTFSIGEQDKRVLVICRRQDLTQAIETGTCKHTAVLEAFGDIVRGAEASPRAKTPIKLQNPRKILQTPPPDIGSNSDLGRERSQPQQLYIPPALRRLQNGSKTSQMASTVKGDDTNNSRGDDPDTGKSSSTDDEDGSWDKKFNDDGDPADAETMRELEKALGKIKIVKPNVINYLEFSPSLNAQYEIKDEDERGNILELYDFPTEFRTHDLNAFFASSGRDLEIHWVDDNHALALFTTSSAARHALQNTKDGMIKRRPFSKASEQSKLKAKDIVQLPAKARPQTSSLTAKRLVSGALGIRIPISKEEREKEKLQLKEAKEKRRLAKQQKKDAWEDD